jgi:hypothetical protein
LVLEFAVYFLNEGFFLSQAVVALCVLALEEETNLLMIYIPGFLSVEGFVTKSQVWTRGTYKSGAGKWFN